jgi:hypothetical protein
MAKQVINIGTASNSGNGDPLRTSFTKVNENFTELYARNVFSGAYNDLTGKPTLFSGAYNDLTGKPTLFSGAYNDLTNKPTIPTDISNLTDTTNLLGGGSGGALINSTQTFSLNEEGNVIFSGETGGVNRGLVWDYGAATGGENSTVRQDQNGLSVRAWTEVGDGVYSAPVNIVTNQSENEKRWTFDGNGNLALPEGGTITEGIVTSNPTIQLTPANPDVASQKLVIKGGGNYNSTENGINLNWYVINPQVGDTVEIFVYSEANANQTLYWWIHPTSANIATPDSGTLTLNEGGASNDGPISFVVDSDDYEFTVRVSPTNNVYDSATIGVESLIFNEAAPTFGGDHHLHLTTGDLTETSIFLGTDNHNVRTTTDGKIQITTPTEGTNVWEFDTNGDVTLPDNGGIVFDRNNTSIRVGMGFHIASGEGIDIQAIDQTDPDNLIYKNWYFGTDGSLTFPDNTLQETAWAGGRVVNVPDSSIGAAGNKQSDMAFNNGYIYYCTADYVSSNLVPVTTLASSGTFVWVDSTDYTGDLVADFTANPTGWTYNGVAIVSVAVDNGFGPGYLLEGTTGFGTSNGDNFALFSPLGLPNIWKRIAWSNDTW